MSHTIFFQPFDAPAITMTECHTYVKKGDKVTLNKIDYLVEDVQLRHIGDFFREREFDVMVLNAKYKYRKDDHAKGKGVY